MHHRDGDVFFNPPLTALSLVYYHRTALMNHAQVAHAAALARELEAEMERLDARQHMYVQELVAQLNDVSFLALDESVALSLPQSSFVLPPNERCFGLATNAIDVNGKACSRQAVPLSNHAGVFFTAPSLPANESPHLTRASRQEARAIAASCRVSNAVPAPTSASTVLDVCGESSNGQGIRLKKKTPASDDFEGQVHRVSSPLPPTSPKTPPPLPQRSRREEEVRRARRALQCIREERDAHFNAKARRAQQLLREGREAVRKSHERRLAELTAAPPPKKVEQ